MGTNFNDSINGATGSGANSVNGSGTSSTVDYRSGGMSSDRQQDEQQRRGSGMSSKQ